MLNHHLLPKPEARPFHYSGSVEQSGNPLNLAKYQLSNERHIKVDFWVLVVFNLILWTFFCHQEENLRLAAKLLLP